jgi:hypothetical protein
VGANFSCQGSWILLAPVIKPSEKHFHKIPQERWFRSYNRVLRVLAIKPLKCIFTINCKRSWFRSYDMALEVAAVWMQW